MKDYETISKETEVWSSYGVMMFINSHHIGVAIEDERRLIAQLKEKPRSKRIYKDLREAHDTVRECMSILLRNARKTRA